MAQLEFSLRKSFAPSGGTPGFELNVSLACDAGITVIFGASGSGKTLTLDSLAGLLRPDAGRILLHDKILFDSGSGACLPPQRRTVGYVLQNYALFPHLTLEQNLSFGIHRLPSLERHRRVREMMELFGLAERAGHYPHQLSGGQRQRASIARALVTEPRLLLLDEPVRGLDYPLRAEFYQILGNVRQRYKIPILLVTHDVAEGFFLGDRMAVYGSGEIVQVGSPEEIFHHPRSPAIARLLGVTNIFSGVLEDLDPMAGRSRLRTAQFSLTLPYLPGRLKGDPVRFCIPPEQVLLSPPNSAKAGPERDNRVPVRIAEEVFTPNTVRLRLDLRSENGSALAAAEAGVQIEAEVTRAGYQRMKLAQQKDWVAELPAGSIHIFSDSRDQQNR